MSNQTAIGLFSGAGGLDVGLEAAGFELKACVELEQVRCETLAQNRPQWTVLQADIRNISGDDLLSHSECEQIDLIAAGPPCQPFSKSAYWQTEGKVIDAVRSQLIFEPVRIAREMDAKAVIIENVPGLCYHHARPILDELLANLSEAGYYTTWGVIDAASYGVPQHRKRLLVFGMRDRLPTLPRATHEAGGYVTAGQALGNLEENPISTQEQVNGKYGELLRYIPPGQNYIYLTERGEGDSIFRYRSKYWNFLLKLSPERPSWTVASDVGMYTGPFHWDSRRLSIPELKRLQTIPDDWAISGGYRTVRKQIGDALPPLFAQRVGEHAIKQLRG
jgi:DNA (cytosine-5)-methyltransferase 1